ncbi:hypothetical protein AHAS_Ahas18G0157700 [Arachis hypogaea]
MLHLDAQVARLSEGEGLVCHAFDTKWHVQPFGPLSLSLKICTSVLCLDAQLGRLFSVALLSLACHAWLFKWHAQVTFEAGVPCLPYQVACPGDDPFWSDELAYHAHGSSGTPIVCEGLGVLRPFSGPHYCSLENYTGMPRPAPGVPRPVPGVPRPCNCLRLPSGLQY